MIPDVETVVLWVFPTNLVSLVYAVVVLGVWEEEGCPSRISNTSFPLTVEKDERFMCLRSGCTP